MPVSNLGNIQTVMKSLLTLKTGIMATPFSLTEDGHELQIGSNHFGHFLLFRLLEPMLSQSATSDSPSRVIALSSAGHRFSSIRFDDMSFEKGDYNGLVAYAQSKTANIWMCNSIDRHYGPKIRGLSVHPGTILTTDITRHFDADTLGSAGDLEHFKKTGCNVHQGAATTVWAALEPRFNEYGGVYLAEVERRGPLRRAMGPMFRLTRHMLTMLREKNVCGI